MDIYEEKKKVVELIHKVSSYMQNSPQKSLEYANQVLQRSQELDFKQGIGMGWLNIGLANYYLGNYSTAIEYYQKTYEFLQENNLERGIGQVLNNLGAVYIRLNDFEKALHYFTITLPILERNEQHLLKSMTLTNIANIMKNSGNIDEAIKHYDKSLKLAEKIDSLHGQCTALINLATLEIDKGDFDQGLQYLQRAKEISLQCENYDVLIQANINMSTISHEQGNLDEALKHLNIADENMIKANLFKDYLYISVRKSELLLELNRWEEAAEILTDLEERYADDEKVKFKDQVYFLLHKYHLLKNDPVSALNYFKKYHELKLKIVERNNSETLVALRTRYEVETKEKELELMKQQKEKLEQEVEEGIRKWKEQHQLLIQKSKLESLGKIAAGIAHEINQPLQAMSLGLENISNKIQLNKLSNEYMEKKSQSLSENILRIKKIIEHIRIFSRQQTSLEINVFYVNSMIEKTLSVTSVQYQKHGIELVVNLCDEDLLVLGNTFRLEQVLFNLLSNARDVLEQDELKNKKTIKITSGRNEKNIILKVRDNGRGITEENRENIFNPFFTTKSPETGTGLGLSIAYGIIKEMNGEITVESEENEFTEFTVTLPWAGVKDE